MRRCRLRCGRRPQAALAAACFADLVLEVVPRRLDAETSTQKCEQINELPIIQCTREAGHDRAAPLFRWRQAGKHHVGDVLSMGSVDCGAEREIEPAERNRPATFMTVCAGSRVDLGSAAPARLTCGPTDGLAFRCGRLRARTGATRARHQGLATLPLVLRRFAGN